MAYLGLHFDIIDILFFFILSHGLFGEILKGVTHQEKIYLLHLS